MTAGPRWYTYCLEFAHLIWIISYYYRSINCFDILQFVFSVGLKYINSRKRACWILERNAHLSDKLWNYLAEDVFFQDLLSSMLILPVNALHPRPGWENQKLQSWEGIWFHCLRGLEPPGGGFVKGCKDEGVRNQDPFDQFSYNDGRIETDGGWLICAWTFARQTSRECDKPLNNRLRLVLQYFVVIESTLREDSHLTVFWEIPAE